MVVAVVGADNRQRMVVAEMEAGSRWTGQL
jgi:hypothetical protein